jgi:hypothetical protein
MEDPLVSASRMGKDTIYLVPVKKYEAKLIQGEKESHHLACLAGVLRHHFDTMQTRGVRSYHKRRRCQDCVSTYKPHHNLCQRTGPAKRLSNYPDRTEGDGLGPY